MHAPPMTSRLLAGAGAGLAATAGMYAMHTANRRWAPATMPPMREDPGRFMVEQAESVLPEAQRERIPQAVATTASSALHWAYGAAAGLLYASLRHSDPNVLRDGLLLGLGVWAAGYLGWLPATGLMPPVAAQRASQAVLPVLQHAAFGVATVAVYDRLRRRAG